MNTSPPNACHLRTALAMDSMDHLLVGLPSCHRSDDRSTMMNQWDHLDVLTRSPVTEMNGAPMD